MHLGERFPNFVRHTRFSPFTTNRTVSFPYFRLMESPARITRRARRRFVSLYIRALIGLAGRKADSITPGWRTALEESLEAFKASVLGVEYVGGTLRIYYRPFTR